MCMFQCIGDFDGLNRMRTGGVSDGIDDRKHKLPTVFKWEGGGKHVCISGSFNQWKTKIPMAKRWGGWIELVECGGVRWVSVGSVGLTCALFKLSYTWMHQWVEVIWWIEHSAGMVSQNRGVSNSKTIWIEHAHIWVNLKFKTKLLKKRLCFSVKEISILS